MGLQGWQWVIIIVLALLLFGAPKVPKMARSLGQSMRIFKSEIRQMKNDDQSEDQSDHSQGADSKQRSSDAVEGRLVDEDNSEDQEGSRNKTGSTQNFSRDQQ